MAKAIIKDPAFSVEMLLTDFRFSKISQSYPGSWPVPDPETGVVEQVPMNLVQIQYELLAGKWKKTVQTVQPVDPGNPESEMETVTEDVWVDFGSPVLVDFGSLPIPNALHLLIENYLESPSGPMLAVINQQIAGFEFLNSLEGFILKVSEISQ